MRDWHDNSRIGKLGAGLAGAAMAPIVALGVLWAALWIVIGVAWLLHAVGLG